MMQFVPCSSTHEFEPITVDASTAWGLGVSPWSPFLCANSMVERVRALHDVVLQPQSWLHCPNDALIRLDILRKQIDDLRRDKNTLHALGELQWFVQVNLESLRYAPPSNLKSFFTWILGLCMDEEPAPATKGTSTFDNEFADTANQLLQYAVRDILGGGKPCEFTMIMESVLNMVVPAAVLGRKQTQHGALVSQASFRGKCDAVRFLRRVTTDMVNVLRIMKQERHTFDGEHRTLNLIQLFATMQDREENASSVLDTDLLLQAQDMEEMEHLLDEALDVLLQQLLDRMVPIDGTMGRLACRSIVDTLLQRVLRAFESPELWLSVIHSLTTVNMTPFPEGPDAASGELDLDPEEMERITQELGIDVVFLTKNVLRFAEPSVLLRTITTLGQHVMDSSVSKIGRVAREAMLRPVGEKRIQWLLKLATGLLWQETDADVTFIKESAMYKSIQDDVETTKAHIASNVATQVFSCIATAQGAFISRAASFTLRGPIERLCLNLFTFMEHPLLLRFFLLRYIDVAAFPRL